MVLEISREAEMLPETLGENERPPELLGKCFQTEDGIHRVADDRRVLARDIESHIAAGHLAIVQCDCDTKRLACYSTKSVG